MIWRRLDSNAGSRFIVELGARPVVEFPPYRVKDLRLLNGAELKPVIRHWFNKRMRLCSPVGA
jgi:hypothetical protein